MEFPAVKMSVYNSGYTGLDISSKGGTVKMGSSKPILRSPSIGFFVCGGKF